jgi:hypothetical protein
MSVWGQPTRGWPDGSIGGPERGGRGGKQNFVHQPRRQRFGWDGCRDRNDGRNDLPWKLLWLQPSQRWNMRSVFSEQYDILVMFGGSAYTEPAVPLFNRTIEHRIVGDLWQYDINNCPHNCSLHGECRLGYCFCDDGFYGIDCSNTSCPGDYCYYDEFTNEQHCKHCCSAAHEFYAEDPDSPVGLSFKVDVVDRYYEYRERKVQCDADHPGEEHGICDGFGHCQCRPPFLGDDCSLLDCPNRCSGHGTCDLSYPHSRCVCDPKWENLDCSAKGCLNNCSYPNGVCNNGRCACADIMNPYNNTEKWARYEGEDCSFITPFAAAARDAGPGVAALLCALACAALVRDLGDPSEDPESSDEEADEGAECGGRGGRLGEGRRPEGGSESSDEEREPWGGRSVRSHAPHACGGTSEPRCTGSAVGGGGLGERGTRAGSPPRADRMALALAAAGLAVQYGIVRL